MAPNHYSDHDCGGPEVCVGCSSWRHGVYDNGSGDPAALRVMRRVRARGRPAKDDEP
jgi:hypothetical protein